MGGLFVSEIYVYDDFRTISWIIYFKTVSSMQAKKKNDLYRVNQLH